MKKFNELLVFIISLFIFSTGVNAASGASLSVSSSNVYVGDTFTVSVNATEIASWAIHVAAEGPVSGCSINEADSPTDVATVGNRNKTFSATCTATGTGTITVSFINRSNVSYLTDMVTYNSEKIYLNGSKTVTVSEKTTKQKFTVSFNSNGHGTAPASQTVEQDSTARDPGSISANGFEFGGWFTDVGCTSRFSFSTPITRNYTLYAKWTKVTSPTQPTQKPTQATQPTQTQSTQPTQATQSTTTQSTQPGETTTSTTTETTTVEAPIAFNTFKVGDYPVTLTGYTYRVKVASNIEEIEVTGTVPDGYTVEGLGIKTLAVGENNFTITITTADGRTQEYGLVITRPDPNVVTSTKLIKLKIDGYDLDFKSDVKEYKIKIPKDVEELHIDAEAENSAVKITGIGDVTLAKGKNILKITASYGELATTTYTITVERESSSALVIVLIGLLVGGLGIGAFFVIKSNKEKKENTENEIAANEAREEAEESENANSTIGGEDVFGVGKRLVEPTLVGIEEAPDNYIDEPINYVANAGEITEDSNFVKPIEVEPEEEKEDIASKFEKEEKDVVISKIGEPESEDSKESKLEFANDEEEDRDLINDTIKIKYSIDKGDEEKFDKVKELLEDTEEKSVSEMSDDDFTPISLDELTKDVLEDNVSNIEDGESSENQVKVEKVNKKPIPKPLKKLSMKTEKDI